MHPEDESNEMTDLANVLNFRLLLVGRRWNGEDVTLRQVIDEAVNAQVASDGSGTR